MVKTSAAVVAACAALFAGCASSAVALGPATAGHQGQGPRAGHFPKAQVVPQLRVQTVAAGLTHPWDVGFLPGGSVLVTERTGRLTLLSSARPGATASTVSAKLPGVYAAGEGGLLGLVIHPDFAQSRQFTTCLDFQSNGAPVDIRLVTWRLADDGRSVTFVKNLLTGLPINPSGRHSGCRTTVAADGSLIVGTGDVAVGRNPQDLTSLAGKTLRLDLKTGQPKADNPFITASNTKTRYVLSFGHRNIQGVAIQPGTGKIFTAEHGSNVDDEVNVIRPGGNYGWDPSRGGTTSAYDESGPMTDLRLFPNAVRAAYSTGNPTEALSGATFLTGKGWGALQGSLAVAALKGSTLFILRVNGDTVTEVTQAAALDGTFGRLRGVRMAPDGALLVTTSNGNNDKVLRVAPTYSQRP